MANILWWRGHATSDSVWLCVAPESNGTLTISGDAEPEVNNLPSDRSVKDGVVVFKFSGLAPDTTYDLSVTNGVDTEPCSIKSAKAGNVIPHKFAVFSCIDEAYDFTAGKQMVKLGVDIVFNQGDVSYGQASSPNPYGINWIPANTGNGQPGVGGFNVSDANAHMRGFHYIPGIQALDHSVRNYLMPDDHDGLGGNDFDHSIASCNNASGVVLGITTQAEADTHWDTCNQAQIAYMQGNPDSHGTTTAADIAPAAAETDVNKYPARYFKFREGHVEYFVIDPMPHRDTVNSDGQFLGSTQLALFVNDVITSTATFKFIITNKKLFTVGAGDNSDTMAKYPTERDFILTQIRDVTGVVWFSGDTHNATASWRTQEEIDASALPMIDICACPAGKDFTTNIGAGYAPPVKWKISGNDGDTLDPNGDDDGPTNRSWSSYRVFTFVEAESDYADITVIDLTGRVKGTWRLYAGKQTLEEVDANPSISLGL